MLVAILMEDGVWSKETQRAYVQVQVEVFAVTYKHSNVCSAQPDEDLMLLPTRFQCFIAKMNPWVSHDSQPDA